MEVYKAPVINSVFDIEWEFVKGMTDPYKPRILNKPTEEIKIY
jgi:hypothetical protein